jgi:hypothetical protein
VVQVPLVVIRRRTHDRALLIAVTLLLLFGLFVHPGCGPRYDSSGSPAARALYATGDAARKAGRHAEAAGAFRRAVEVDPDFVDAHQGRHDRPAGGLSGPRGAPRLLVPRLSRMP